MHLFINHVIHDVKRPDGWNKPICMLCFVFIYMSTSFKFAVNLSITEVWMNLLMI